MVPLQNRVGPQAACHIGKWQRLLDISGACHILNCSPRKVISPALQARPGGSAGYQGARGRGQACLIGILDTPTLVGKVPICPCLWLVHGGLTGTQPLPSSVIHTFTKVTDVSMQVPALPKPPQLGQEAPWLLKIIPLHPGQSKDSQQGFVSGILVPRNVGEAPTPRARLADPALSHKEGWTLHDPHQDRGAVPDSDS